jgi:mediator of RNA polymerase II transcription subunit 10
MDKDSFDALEEHLELLIEQSRQLGIMASNFQDQSQNALNSKFASLSSCLRNINMMKDSFSEVKVPVSVFR